MASGTHSEAQRRQLEEQYKTLNPFALKQQIEAKDETHLLNGLGSL